LPQSAANQKQGEEMNILIVGAGAVGLVYGQAFADTGHQVTFLIKPQHEEALKDGATLIRKRRLKPDRVTDFTNFKLLTDWALVKQQPWDMVMLAIPSPALRQLPFETIRDAIGNAVLVMLQPSAADGDLLRTYWPATQLAKGMITIISYYYPMPGETRLTTQKPLTVAWYLPPASMPISGESDAAAQTIKLFRTSGLPAKRVRNAVASSRLPSALLMTFLCALEAANWSLKQLRQDKALLKELVAAQKALLATLAEQYPQEGSVPMTARCLSSWLYRTLLRLAPLSLPFSVEVYLQEHFTKVRSQTDLYMQEYCRLCSDGNLKKLHQRIFS
jgi:2-dehydropantoate 2-reductase